MLYAPEQMTAMIRASELLNVGLRAHQMGHRPEAEAARRAVRTTLVDAGLDPDDDPTVWHICEMAANLHNRLETADTVCHLPGALPCVQACFEVCPRWVQHRLHASALLDA